MKTFDNLPSILVNFIITGAIVCLPMAAQAVRAESPVQLENEHPYQTSMLFSPSANQRVLEERGRVMIYDGLRDVTIEQALDTQFDRLQNMMFTRIIRTGNSGTPLRDKTGKLLVEDDGC